MHTELFPQGEECQPHFPPTGADRLSSLGRFVQAVWPELALDAPQDLSLKIVFPQSLYITRLYGTLQEFQHSQI